MHLRGLGSGLFRDREASNSPAFLVGWFQRGVLLKWARAKCRGTESAHGSGDVRVSCVLCIQASFTFYSPLGQQLMVWW